MLNVNIFLADRKDYDAFNAVYAEVCFTLSPEGEENGKYEWEEWWDELGE